MNKVLSTLFILSAGFLSLAQSQTARITGTVTDTENMPLIAATVIVEGEGSITDLEGRYEIKIAPGTYELTVSYVGYEPHKERVTLSANEEKTLNISLTESFNLLETATVTSGKHEMALGEVTVSIDVIKPALVESTNQTTLSGLLEKVPGINMIGDQANIRGGSGFSYGAGSRVLLLIDDMPIYQADAGFPQWEDVPLENVEQIEVVKGAASALYGSSALNGIVNVRTAYAKSKPETSFAPFYTVVGSPKNEQLKWWDEAPYSAGFSAAHRRKMGKFDLVLGSYYYRADSYQDSSFTRRGRITVNTRYRINDRLSVGINSNFNKSKGSSYFFWQDLDNMYRPGTSVSNSNNLRYNIDPYLTYFDKSDNRHKFMGRFFNVDNETGTLEADQSNISQVFYGEYQFQRKMEKLDMMLTTGFVYNGSRVRAPLYGDTTFVSDNLAGYLQLEKKFDDRLNISAGFRFEANTLRTPDSMYFESDLVTVGGSVPNGKIKESKPVFRVGASYEISPTSFLRASWGQGYRFPTIAEKFIFTQFGGLPIIPNFDLQSETGWTAEIGLRKGFKVSNFNAFVDVSTFWSEYSDMMEFTFIIENFNAFFQSQNIGDTRITGYEISVNGQGSLFGLQTTLMAGYTYIDPKFKEFGLDLPEGSRGRTNARNSSICNTGNAEDCVNVLKYRYKHTAKFDMETRYKKASIGLAAFYTSYMENIDAVFELFLVNQEGQPIGLREFRQTHNNGDLVLNLRGAYFLTNQLKASILVKNFTNREYSSRPGKLDAPINYTLRMDYNF